MLATKIHIKSNEPEKEYAQTISLEHRKKFAQFFTPEQIATFMTNWLLNGKMGTLNILEPAIGLGIFTRTMLKTNPLINVIGYDIDETIFKITTYQEIHQ